MGVAGKISYTVNLDVKSSDLKAYPFNQNESLHPVTNVDIDTRIITIFSLHVLLLIFIDGPFMTIFWVLQAAHFTIW